MAAFVFNSSGVAMKVSVNNGDFFSVPAANTNTWVPASPETQPPFVNQTNPGQGKIGLGDNTITMYPATSGPSDSANFTLTVPTDVTVSSLQVYLFWKDAQNVAWAALNGGQFVQVETKSI
jgi:hypothetical protein